MCTVLHKGKKRCWVFWLLKDYWFLGSEANQQSHNFLPILINSSQTKLVAIKANVQVSFKQIFAWRFSRFSCRTFLDFSSNFSTFLFLMSEWSLFFAFWSNACCLNKIGLSIAKRRDWWPSWECVWWVIGWCMYWVPKWSIIFEPIKKNLSRLQPLN